MLWLADGSADSVATAIRIVAPGLADRAVVVRSVAGRDEPLWQASSARIGDDFVAKFAWSELAARRVAHEIGVLTALQRLDHISALPTIVASSLDPVLLITRRAAGTSLFDIVDTIDRDLAGRQLAQWLVALHRESTKAAVEAAIGPLSVVRAGSQHPATTSAVRERLRGFVRADRWGTVTRWCDWADTVLADRPPTVLVHADFHGDNQVWEDDRLRLVVDFETAGAAEPEYDLRALPGTGPGVELVRATVAHYETISGRHLDIDRIMAWHLRTVLDDALWRSEAGVPMPDHRPLAAWIDDLELHLAAFRNPAGA